VLFPQKGIIVSSTAHLERIIFGINRVKIKEIKSIRNIVGMIMVECVRR
jgi:hypothetical protein